MIFSLLVLIYFIKLILITIFAKKLHNLGKRIHHISGRCTHTILSAGFGKAAVCILFLFFNVLHSQEGVGTAPTISVNSDAKIYSADSDFTRQFISQENADYEIISSGKAHVFKSKSNPSVKKIAKRKPKASVQTDQAGQRRIKKDISDFEHQKKPFDFYNIHGAPFSRELPYSSNFNRSYIVPSTTSNEFSKACIYQYNYLIRLILERHYVWNYHYFNNRSLDFCFSEIFSVRPPPLFLV